MNKNKIYLWLGNLFILLSLLGFFFIFYPIVHVYLSPPKLKPFTQTEGAFLRIPKIKAYAKVIENVDPFKKDEYNAVLKTGVAHAKGTSLPGNQGTIFIFAHSSAPPWELARNNTIFLRLGELEKGDMIEIQRDNKLYRYKVTEKKEVMPSEINYLLDTKKDQLILQTCTPIGTDWMRLLVFAVPE